MVSHPGKVPGYRSQDTALRETMILWSRTFSHAHIVGPFGVGTTISHFADVRAASSARRSAIRAFETRKFVAMRRLRADGKSSRRLLAAARNTPGVPVFGIPSSTPQIDRPIRQSAEAPLAPLRVVQGEIRKY